VLYAAFELPGNQTICRQTNAQLVKSRTGQLADWITHGLDNSLALCLLCSWMFCEFSLHCSVVGQNAI